MISQHRERDNTNVEKTHCVVFNESKVLTSNSSNYTLVRRRTVRPVICAARSCCLRHSVEAQRCVSLWTRMRRLWWGTALYFLWLPRVIIIFYITSSHLLLTLFGHRPLASLYESLRNGTFYPAHKIPLMRDSVTVGYCFLFVPKYKRFPHLLTCWFVIIVLRTARKLQTLTKYVAYYWLRLVRSVNSSISKWLLPSDILNYTTSNHSLILSRKFFEDCNFEATSLHFLLWLFSLCR